jgi:SAM-dependent methyltransferase
VDAKFKGDRDLGRLAGGRYELMECKHCGLLYQRTVPSDFFVAEFYDAWLNTDEHETGIDVGGKRIGLDRGVELSREIATLLRTTQLAPSDLQVLDYGMGWGHWCAIAQAMGCKTYGWDLSRQRRDFAKSRGIQVPEFEELSTLRFDIVNVEQVFEHLVEPRAVLEQLASMLKPGGILKIGVPDGRHVKRGLSSVRWGHLARDREFMRHLMPITPLIHINTFTAESLARFGAQAGLQPIRAPLSAEFAVLPGSSWRRLVTALLRPGYRRLVPTTWQMFRRH